MATTGDWTDSYNGVQDPMQYQLNSDGSTSAVQQIPQQASAQSSPLSGLASALMQYGSSNPSIGMPGAPTYAQQGLDVPSNSAFIDPASTNISIEG